jgi:hypothetical protein
VGARRAGDPFTVLIASGMRLTKNTKKTKKTKHEGVPTDHKHV